MLPGRRNAINIPKRNCYHSKSKIRKGNGGSAKILFTKPIKQNKTKMRVRKSIAFSAKLSFFVIYSLVIFGPLLPGITILPSKGSPLLSTNSKYTC